MATEFNGQSLQEGKKTFHSITTDNDSFNTAGMSLFSTDDIYGKFIKTTEKGSTCRIFTDTEDVTAAITDQRPAALRAATHLMVGSAFEDDPKMMIWDKVAKQYVEEAWGWGSDLFLTIFLAEREKGMEDEERTKILGEASNYTVIETAAYIAKQYNLGEYAIVGGESPEERAAKLEKSNFVKFVQTSLSGCISWSAPFQFVFNGDAPEPGGNTPTVCIVESTAKFEFRIFDNISPKRDKRKLVFSGKPTFSFIPSTPWGTNFAGGVPTNGSPGALPPLRAGGENNSKNHASAQLDVSFNPNTGKAEAGTHQVLAKMITPLSKVKINAFPAIGAIDEIEGEEFQEGGLYQTGYWASGYAIPLSVHNSNPDQFGPTMGGDCDNPNKKERLLVINRSQKSFPVGRIVMLQRIDDEWIPLDFGDDDEDFLPLSVGKWGFQYLIADNDSYFKDDRHYYEEQYQAELSSSVTSMHYEAMFRMNFYSTIVDAMNQTVNVENFIDSENLGTINLEDKTVTPRVEDCDQQQPEEEVTAGTEAYRIEALNGVYTRILVKEPSSNPTEPQPNVCYEPSDDCAIPATIDAIIAGGEDGAAWIEARMYEDGAYFGPENPPPLSENWTPPGLDSNGRPFESRPRVHHEQYTGKWSLNREPGFSNLSSNNYPNKVYEKTEGREICNHLGECHTTYPFGARKRDSNGQVVPRGAFSPTKNLYMCTFMCSEKQKQTKWAGGLPVNIRTVCVDAGYHPAAVISFLEALKRKFSEICTAEAALAPQIVHYHYEKANLTKRFVGSRRYLNVTSFDMLSSHWNGHNAADWLGKTNPSVDVDGGVLEDPSNLMFEEFNPFWGAVFTDGYTEKSVTDFMAKRGGDTYIRKACSNHGTSLVDGAGGFFGRSYLSHGGGTPPTQDNLTSYARTYEGGPLSLDRIHSLGDINFCNLPADIGTNASPSGTHGTPITDFHRMINLVNVVTPGTGYKPFRSDETPTAEEAINTIDWGNGAGSEHPPLAMGVKKYFARKHYNIAGHKFSIPDRHTWVYDMYASYTSPADENGNELGVGDVTLYSFDSHYDLEPLSKGNITFMPLTAEWIGAFDSHDEIYAQHGMRASDEPFHGAALAQHPGDSTVWGGLSLPVGYPNSKTIGAGWYWNDNEAKSSQMDNMTIKRLSHYPLDSLYSTTPVNDKGIMVNGTHSTDNGSPATFPGADYAAFWSGLGGRRGDPIFRIGRHNMYIATEIMDMIETGDGTSTGLTTQEDIEFMETENEGGILYPPVVYTYNPSTPDDGPTHQDHRTVYSHGLYLPKRADGLKTLESHKVILEPGFPFDGYVRHRTDDYSILAPVNAWQFDSADCVGIITAKCSITTGASTLILDTVDTRGLPAVKLTVDGDDIGQWGGVGSNISSMGGAHLFARAFEAWPDDQTLFDSRYFAVMHFNAGELLTPPPNEEFTYQSKEYTRNVKDTDVDFRVPTRWGEGLDASTWEMVGTGIAIYSNSSWLAPLSLSRVNTVRRGMLLPFTYVVPTVGIAKEGIFMGYNLNGDPEKGAGFVIGDRLTFSGGVGINGQIRVTEVDIAGGILDWELINAGQDYIAADFMTDNWHEDHARQNDQDFKTPVLIAQPDEGVFGKGAFIVATKGVTTLKETTDKAPQTGQNAPVRVTTAVPKDYKDGVPREEDKASSLALSLIGADGANNRSYDVFLHYHNDITSVLSHNHYKTAGRNVLDGNSRVQFLRLSINTR
jgi:hypothetical protein